MWTISPPGTDVYLREPAAISCRSATGPLPAVGSREGQVHFKATGHRIGLTKAKPEFDIDLRRPAEARQSAEKVWDKMWGGVSARRQKLFPNKPLELDDGDPYGI